LHKSFDMAEADSLVMLLAFLCAHGVAHSEGISVVMNRHYVEFSTISRWNACYVGGLNTAVQVVSKEPSTVVEYMMMAKFGNILSLLEVVH